MDQAVAFLAALRAAQHLAGAPLMAARIETLAASLGLQPETLPAVIATLQREGAVLLVWGGGLGSAGEAGRDAKPSGPCRSGWRCSGRRTRRGHGCRERWTRRGDRRTRRGAGEASGGAADTVTAKGRSARAAESTLVKAVAVDVPASERHGLIRQAVQDVKGLLAYAPQAKDWIDVLQKGASLFS